MKLLNPYTAGPITLALSWVVKAWTSTVDFRIVDLGSTTPARLQQNGLYLLWHENLPLPLKPFARTQLSALVSNHNDGELIARLLQYVGMKTVRGSTNKKGATALRNLMRRGQNQHLAITPDGPRGPRRKVQRGAIYIASRSQLPIVPVGAACHRCYRLRSWDKMCIPRLGTRCYFVYGKTISIPNTESIDELDASLALVQQKMDEVQSHAERLAELNQSWPGDSIERSKLPAPAAS